MPLTLRGRILLTQVPVLVFLVVLGGAGVVLLSHLGGRIDAILRENYDSIVAMERLNEALERIDSSFQFTLAGQETKARDQYRENWPIYREKLRSEQGNVTVPGEQALVDELTALTNQYQQQGEAFYARSDKDPLRQQDYFGRSGLLETFTKIKSVSSQISRINQDNMEKSSRRAKWTAAVSLIGFAFGLAVAMLLAVLTAWYTFHAIVGPIKRVTESARGVSAGNLDLAMPYLSRDALGELAETFNYMTRRLREDRQSADERTKELVRTTETLRQEISEREQMEQSLRQLAAIVESSDDAIVGRSLDGVITSWNKGAERVFGYSAAAVLGQPHSLLVPPEYDGELAALVEKTKHGEHFDHFETVRRRKDGQRIVVSLTFFPVRDQAGAIVGMASISRDITERKRAEEALRRAAAYNRRLLEASLDPLVTIGPDGKITDVNAATEDATGFSRSELLGKDFANYFTEPDRARAGYQRVFSQGTVRNYPLEMRHRDDGVTSVLYNAAVYRDEVGNVGGVFAAARDITERKRAEENVRRLALLQGVVAELGQRALRMVDSAGNLLDEAVALVAQTLEVEFCNVAELLPGGEELILRAGVGWKEGLVGRAIVTSKDSQAGYTVRSDQPVIVEDAATETRFVPIPRLLGETTVSSMSVVVSTPEGSYGALGVHTRARRTFTKDEVNFLQAVANVLGAAIQRKRSEEQLRRSNRALVALSCCNQALIRATDEASLLQQICQIVVEKAGYRLCWVGYAEQDDAKTVRPVAQAGFEEGYLKTVNVTWADTERGRGPTGTCIRTGQPTFLKDLASDPGFAPWRAEAQKRGYASSVGVPLAADSTILGALTIYASELNAFGNEEIALLTELANDLAFGVVALRTRAERNKAVELQVAHEQEVKIGIEIQQTLLLDTLPVAVPGLRVAALTVPSQQIDGDFYQFYQHENESLDVIVADVMGKGVPAALLAAATKSHFLKAFCHLVGRCGKGELPEPKEIVTLAHAEMVQHLINLETFVTLCYVRFDLNKRSLTLVDCGHTGLIHRRAATGMCETVHGANLALGMRQGEIYDQLSVSFDVGDLLLLYSDGVTETRNQAGELFGEDRLLQCVQTNSQLEPEELVKAIRHAAFTFSGSESPSDDLTCVAFAVVERQFPLVHQEMEIQSDFKELARARAFVRSACREVAGSPFDEESVGKLELAITEACSNIMKHAYHGRVDQRIHLEAEVFPNKVVVRLHHLGEPFDPSKVSPPRLDGSQDSGFGVYLITRSVDEVRYYRDEHGRNCIALVKFCNS